MKNELQTLRLFSPLFPHIYRKNEWGDYENEPENLDASDILEYEDAILDRIEKEKFPSEGERGLAVYLDDDLSQKYTASIQPLRNGTASCGVLPKYKPTVRFLPLSL